MSPEDKARALAGTHRIIDDCWYSCPASGECCNANAGTACNCGYDDCVKAIAAALTLAKQPLEWTTTRPCQPGWYWWRCKVYVTTFTKVYEVQLFDGELGISVINRLADIEGEWAGPIEPPGEQA